MNQEILTGKTYIIQYPFFKGKVSVFDDEGYVEIDSWIPGVKHIEHYGDIGAFADNHGEMHLTVISTHKPGKFPERIFYTRKWKSPEGKLFGKTKLHIATVTKFRALLRGYRHRYEMGRVC